MPGGFVEIYCVQHRWWYLIIPLTWITRTVTDAFVPRESNLIASIHGLLD